MGRKFASNEDRTKRKNVREAYANKKEKEMLEKRKELEEARESAIRKINYYAFEYESCKEYIDYDFSGMSTKEVLELKKKVLEMAHKEYDARWEAILKKQREKKAKIKAEEEAKAKKKEEEREAKIARQIAYEEECRRREIRDAEWEAKRAQYKAEERARTAELNRNQWRVLPNGTWRLYPSTPNGEVQWKNDCMLVMQWKK